MTAFNAGDSVDLEDGGTITILKSKDKPDEPFLLGAGGQGEVYMVDLNGKKYALKWYTNDEIIASKKFRDNLKKNVDRAITNPSSIPSNFVWPQHLTERKRDRNGKESYGYVMELFPSNYTSMDDYLVGYKIEGTGNARKKVPKRFRDAETRMVAAINIVNGIKDVGRLGLSYQDLNGGGIRMDLDTGDVLICDTDNIGDTPSGIKGFPGYMAPEVVLDKSPPGPLTDRHSLAVALYRLLVVADPFKGKIMYEYKGPVTDAKQREFYGSNPVFCWDPDNDTNRPVIGEDTNSLMLWNMYPKYIQDLFISAFTKGLNDMQFRVTPNKWANALKKAITECFVCPRCKKWGFIDGDDMANGSKKCCGTEHPLFEIHRGNDVTFLPAYPGKKVRMFITNVKDNSDPADIAGEFIENPRHPGVVGLSKTTTEEWYVDDRRMTGPCRVSNMSKVLFGQGFIGGTKKDIYAIKK